MKTLLKYLFVLIASYVAAWTASYVLMFVSRGEGADFTHYFEYLVSAWTFSGGELPSVIWLLSIVAFFPLACSLVFVLRKCSRG